MAMKDVPRNWKDLSTPEGLQFHFFCDHCGQAYESRFVASKKAKWSKGFAVASGLFGALGMRTASQISHVGADATDTRARDDHQYGAGNYWTGHAHYRTAGYEQEYDQAFDQAWAEAKPNFHKCPKCNAWSCNSCWNAEVSLCKQCAPILSVELAAARSQVQVQQMKQQVAQTQVFSGDVSGRQALCPRCGALAGSGKFCNSCGSPIGAQACPQCGAQNNPGVKFCGGCGNKVG
jgi:hypothetical protein